MADVGGARPGAPARRSITLRESRAVTKAKRQAREAQRAQQHKAAQASMVLHHQQHGGWIQQLQDCPVYTPTEDEFADPIAYIRRIQPDAAKYGICKIIPPYLPAVPPGQVLNENAADRRQFSFQARVQELKPVKWTSWTSGDFYTKSKKYKLEEYQALASSYATKKYGSIGHMPPHHVEVEYWRLRGLEPRPGGGASGSGGGGASSPPAIEYGSDLVGTAFARPETGDPLGASKWNLNVLPELPDTLLPYVQYPIPGVTSPMLYIGMLHATFAWHIEDHYLYSVNYHHMGAPKTWYGVPATDADAFEQLVLDEVYDRVLAEERRAGVPAARRRDNGLASLLNKTTVVHPKRLLDRGIRVFRAVQHAGEFVITFPRAYHAGFSHGFNCGEAVNFAMLEWLPYAAAADLRLSRLSRRVLLPTDCITCCVAMEVLEQLAPPLAPPPAATGSPAPATPAAEGSGGGSGGAQVAEAKVRAKGGAGQGGGRAYGGGTGRPPRGPPYSSRSGGRQPQQPQQSESEADMELGPDEEEEAGDEEAEEEAEEDGVAAATRAFRRCRLLEASERQLGPLRAALAVALAEGAAGRPPPQLSALISFWRLVRRHVTHVDALVARGASLVDMPPAADDTVCTACMASCFLGYASSHAFQSSAAAEGAGGEDGEHGEVDRCRCLACACTAAAASRTSAPTPDSNVGGAGAAVAVQCGTGVVINVNSRLRTFVPWVQLLDGFLSSYDGAETLLDISGMGTRESRLYGDVSSLTAEEYGWDRPYDWERCTGQWLGGPGGRAMAASAASAPPQDTMVAAESAAAAAAAGITESGVAGGSKAEGGLSAAATATPVVRSLPLPSLAPAAAPVAGSSAAESHCRPAPAWISGEPRGASAPVDATEPSAAAAAAPPPERFATDFPLVSTSPPGRVEDDDAGGSKGAGGHVAAAVAPAGGAGVDPAAAGADGSDSATEFGADSGADGSSSSTDTAPIALLAVKAAARSARQRGGPADVGPTCGRGRARVRGGSVPTPAGKEQTGNRRPTGTCGATEPPTPPQQQLEVEGAQRPHPQAELSVAGPAMDAETAAGGLGAGGSTPSGPGALSCAPAAAAVQVEKDEPSASAATARETVATTAGAGVAVARWPPLASYAASSGGGPPEAVSAAPADAPAAAGTGDVTAGAGVGAPDQAAVQQLGSRSEQLQEQQQQPPPPQGGEPRAGKRPRSLSPVVTTTSMAAVAAVTASVGAAAAQLAAGSGSDAAAAPVPGGETIAAAAGAVPHGPHMRPHCPEKYRSLQELARTLPTIPPRKCPRPPAAAATPVAAPAVAAAGPNPFAAVAAAAPRRRAPPDGLAVRSVRPVEGGGGCNGAVVAVSALFMPPDGPAPELDMGGLSDGMQVDMWRPPGPGWAPGDEGHSVQAEAAELAEFLLGPSNLSCGDVDLADIDLDVAVGGMMTEADVIIASAAAVAVGGGGNGSAGCVAAPRHSAQGGPARSYSQALWAAGWQPPQPQSQARYHPGRQDVRQQQGQQHGGLSWTAEAAWRPQVPGSPCPEVAFPGGPAIAAGPPPLFESQSQLPGRHPAGSVPHVASAATAGPAGDQPLWRTVPAQQQQQEQQRQQIQQQQQQYYHQQQQQQQHPLGLLPDAPGGPPSLLQVPGHGSSFQGPLGQVQGAAHTQLGQRQPDTQGPWPAHTPPPGGYGAPLHVRTGEPQMLQMPPPQQSPAGAGTPFAAAAVGGAPAGASGCQLPRWDGSGSGSLDAEGDFFATSHHYQQCHQQQRQQPQQQQYLHQQQPQPQQYQQLGSFQSPALPMPSPQMPYEHGMPYAQAHAHAYGQQQHMPASALIRGAQGSPFSGRHPHDHHRPAPALASASDPASASAAAAVAAAADPGSPHGLFPPSPFAVYARLGHAVLRATNAALRPHPHPSAQAYPYPHSHPPRLGPTSAPRSHQHQQLATAQPQAPPTATPQRQEAPPPPPSPPQRHEASFLRAGSLPQVPSALQAAPPPPPPPPRATSLPQHISACCPWAASRPRTAAAAPPLPPVQLPAPAVEVSGAAQSSRTASGRASHSGSETSGSGLGPPIGFGPWNDNPPHYRLGQRQEPGRNSANSQRRPGSGRMSLSGDGGGSGCGSGSGSGDGGAASMAALHAAGAVAGDSGCGCGASPLGDSPQAPQSSAAAGANGLWLAPSGHEAATTGAQQAAVFVEAAATAETDVVSNGAAQRLLHRNAPGPSSGPASGLASSGGGGKPVGATPHAEGLTSQHVGLGPWPEPEPEKGGRPPGPQSPGGSGSARGSRQLPCGASLQPAGSVLIESDSGGRRDAAQPARVADRGVLPSGAAGEGRCQQQPQQIEWQQQELQQQQEPNVWQQPQHQRGMHGLGHADVLSHWPTQAAPVVFCRVSPTRPRVQAAPAVPAATSGPSPFAWGPVHGGGTAALHAPGAPLSLAASAESLKAALRERNRAVVAQLWARGGQSAPQGSAACPRPIWLAGPFGGGELAPLQQPQPAVAGISRGEGGATVGIAWVPVPEREQGRTESSPTQRPSGEMWFAFDGIGEAGPGAACRPLKRVWRDALDGAGPGSGADDSSSLPVSSSAAPPAANGDAAPMPGAAPAAEWAPPGACGGLLGGLRLDPPNFGSANASPAVAAEDLQRQPGPQSQTLPFVQPQL